jgi:hypothetical protein
VLRVSSNEHIDVKLPGSSIFTFPLDQLLQLAIPENSDPFAIRYVQYMKKRITCNDKKVSFTIMDTCRWSLNVKSGISKLFFLYGVCTTMIFNVLTTYIPFFGRPLVMTLGSVCSRVLNVNFGLC